MPDLSVRYLGHDLKNPFVASSSGLTGSIAGIKRCAAAGAAAIVLKSLFEEQIDAELGIGANGSELLAHPEAADYVHQLGKSHGPDSYLELIQSAKTAVDVPVIASVNCVSTRWWLDFAGRIKEAGADALELNIAQMPVDTEQEASEIEERLYRIVRSVRDRIDLPIAVKLGPFYTSLPRVVSGVESAGADAVVLFNRFFQVDVDPNSIELIPGYRFSTPQEVSLPLRWISLLRPQVACALSASTGVHSAADAQKLLLAGATVIQLASALYQQGVDSLQAMVHELEGWMEEKGFRTIDEVRGALMRSSSWNVETVERLQYVQALSRANTTNVD